MVNSFRLVVLALVTFAISACSVSVGIPTNLPDGSCNTKAEASALALCRMSKQMEAMQSELVALKSAKTEAPAAPTASAQPAAPPPQMRPLNITPMSTGAVCETPQALTLTVYNAGREYIEVVQEDGGVEVAPCDRQLLVRIPVMHADGTSGLARTIPPGARVRFVPVVYVRQPNGVLEGKLGDKTIHYNAYSHVLGYSGYGAPRTHHMQMVVSFPSQRGGMQLQTLSPEVMDRG